MPEYDERIHEQLLALSRSQTDRLLHHTASALPGKGYKSCVVQVQTVIKDVFCGDVPLPPNKTLSDWLHELLAQRLKQPIPDPNNRLNAKHILNDLAKMGIRDEECTDFYDSEFCVAPRTTVSKALLNFIDEDGLRTLLKMACQFTGEPFNARDSTNSLPPRAMDLVQEAIARALEKRRLWRPRKVDFTGFIFGVVKSLKRSEVTRTESLPDNNGTIDVNLQQSFNYSDISDQQLRAVMFRFASGVWPEESLEERISTLGNPLAEAYKRCFTQLTASNDWSRLAQLADHIFEGKCLREHVYPIDTENIDTLFQLVTKLDDATLNSDLSESISDQFRKLLWSYRMDAIIQQRLQSPEAKPLQLSWGDKQIARYYHRANARFKRSWQVLLDTLKMEVQIQKGEPSVLYLSTFWEHAAGPSGAITSYLCLHREDHHPKGLDQISINCIHASNSISRFQIKGSRIEPEWPRSFGYNKDEESRLSMLFRPRGAYPNQRAYLRDWAFCLAAAADSNIFNDATTQAQWQKIKSAPYDRTVATHGEPK